MGKPQRRFVARAKARAGWRIWDNMQKKWWGECYVSLPAGLLKELNGPKRPQQLVELIKETPRKRA